MSLKNLLLVLAFSSLFLGCGVKKQSARESTNDLTSYVNPFLGTAPLLDPEIIGYTPPEGWRVWAGLVFPGSSLPNAMVQLSPLTEYGSGAGYEYEDDEILGFAHTNKGHWDQMNIPILPISGEMARPFKSKYSKKSESASPAFYQVHLDDYKVDVRLTSTLRAGVHEYTYADQSDRKILFDLARANHGVQNWEITKKGNTLQGFQQIGHGPIYFYAELNHHIDELEVVRPGDRKGYAFITLSDKNPDPVLLKIGLSFVSIENAAENLKTEVGERTFNEIHDAGKRVWNDLLSQIQVKGGTQKQRELFYSSLYRSFLWPALRSDVNGQFVDAARKVRQEEFNYYTTPALWDTYRNKLVLLGLIRPDVTNDVIKSLIDRGNITGFIPTFFHGDHAAPFIAGSYFRGIGDFDVNNAYQLLLNNAYKQKGARPHIKEYIEKGFISDPDVKKPHVETKAKAGVSKTLEYAHDDYALSLLAKSLGDEKHFIDLQERSQNYRNVFDKSTNFMRGRLANGDWINPFNPQYPYYEYMYREANAWQVSFYVNHDMPGLIKLYGGERVFENKLDSLFTVPWNPRYIARNISGFIGQYSHGNQPDHEAPFAYYFIDKPEKSQAILDRIFERFYGAGEFGLALGGMDDAGEMSSWYVFSAGGLYPFSTADANYLLTVPIFDEVKWQIKGKKPVIIRNSSGGRELKGITLGDESLQGYFISHDLFDKGGVIALETD